MPVYKFNFTNGEKTIPDEWGLTLPDDGAALREAHNIARDLQEASDEDWSPWVIEVTDETGRGVAAIRMSEVAG